MRPIEMLWWDGRFGTAVGEHPLFTQDGLLETLRITRGHPWALAAHLDRLRRGCRCLGLTLPPHLPVALQEYLQRSGLREGVLRLWLGWGDGRESLLITGETGDDPRRTGILLGLSTARPESGPRRQIKTTALLARRGVREGLPPGAGEGLVLNDRGEVAEALFANLFWIRGRDLFTPARSCGGLPGVTRAWVLRRAPSLGYRVRVGRYPLAELQRAGEIFLTNARGGILPVCGLLFAPEWRPDGEDTRRWQERYLRSEWFDGIPEGLRSDADATGCDRDG